MVFPKFVQVRGDKMCSQFFKITLFTVITFLVLFAVQVKSDDGENDAFCPLAATVDLSQARKNSSGFVTEDGLVFPGKTVRVVDGVLQGCVCDLKPCLAVCPRTNDTLRYSALPKVYGKNFTEIGDEDDVDKRFHIHIWDPCAQREAYFLDPVRYKNDEFYLMENGSLFLPQKVNNKTRIFDFRKFCFRIKGNSTIYMPRVCSSPNAKTDRFVIVKYIGVVIAVPFIIATIFVYSFLPELRNIHGTTLRCYLSCLLVTHVTLAADRIPAPDYDAGPFCLTLGFTIYFSFLASFFWLNVMCVDMWWRLGGFGSLRSSGQSHDRKKFIGYSIYAWGSAIILTVICIAMEFAPISAESSLIVPGFRQKVCWFATRSSAALYFFGPIGITIACNICLFVSTSIKIVRHKNETQRHLNTGDSKRHDDNKQWFSLYLKLFIVMGISWSTEVISWLWRGPIYVWYVTDMVNALQGLLIFVIFVCKKNICQSLKKRYKELKITKKGCKFISGSSESPATSASLDDSVIRCNVNVMGLKELPKINQNQSQSQSPNSVAVVDGHRTLE